MTEQDPPSQKILPEKAVEIPELGQNLPQKQTTAWKMKELQKDAILEIESRPGQYTYEKIKHWKGLGLEKPEFVPTALWDSADKDLKPLEGIVCHLTAIGMEPDQIAKATGKAPEYIRKVLGKLPAQEEVQRIQDMVWGDNFKKVIERIVPFAIQTAVQVMLDENTKAQTRADTAFKFITQAMGKPVQQVDIQDNLIRKIYEQLDGKNVIDLTQKRAESSFEAQTNVPAPKGPDESSSGDPIDAWVKENL